MPENHEEEDALPRIKPHHVFIAVLIAAGYALNTQSQSPARINKPGRPVAGTASIVATQLKTESTVDPLGIDAANPRLSWILAARSTASRGLSQSAYRVLISSSPERLRQTQGDIWDTGKVASSQTFGISYAGPSVRPCTSYYWKVIVWDQDGTPSPWSPAAQWTTGLLNASDWSAHWIAATPDKPDAGQTRENVGELGDYPPPLPIFRRDFRVEKPIRRAIAFVSGIGQYELRINGANVTDSTLNPGWTDYRKTVLYNSWDVTHLLHPGSNALGAMLGNGMYNVDGTKGRYTKFIGSFGQPKMILELRIEYTDGTRATIVTDHSWKTSAGPITYTSIYGGEDYDAQREQAGWDKPGFHDASWTDAHEVSGPGGTLQSQSALMIKVAHVYSADRPTRPRPGTLVYDLGQNFSGWPDIVVHGPRGSTVKLIPGELLDGNGLVTQHSMNADPEHANLFVYTLSGHGIEHWRPRFSYTGFRYVQVEGGALTPSGNKPVIVAMRGDFIHASAPVVGHFTTSNQLFERIHTLIDMAILSNMVSVLTDCPHREKLGWLEQTHLAGTSILYNYDASALYDKMALDMRDAQLPNGMVPAIAPEFVAFVDSNGVSTSFRDSPEWGSASILSPWTEYQLTANQEVLSESYPMMVKYASYLRSRMKNGMLTYGLGDWYDIGPKDPGESQLTEKGMTATATYFECLIALAHIAEILGKPSEAAAFRAEAKDVRDSINAHLLHSDKGQYDRNSQTANAMPLALGIVPDAAKQAVLQSLVDDIHQHQDHVTAGDIGFHYVVRALTDAGRSDVLNAMLLRKDSPSYGYQLEKGATTLTEAWDTNRDNSQNHFMLGHAEEWFYRGLAGIDIDMSRAAPRQIILHPTLVSGTNDASATYESVLGTIASGWSRKGNVVAMNVSIPPGAVATVVIPTADAASIRESSDTLAKAKGITSCDSQAGATTCVVTSGSYRFQFKN
jgi:hypothetical protein